MPTTSMIRSTRLHKSFRVDFSDLGTFYILSAYLLACALSKREQYESNTILLGITHMTHLVVSQEKPLSSTVSSFAKIMLHFQNLFSEDQRGKTLTLMPTTKCTFTLMLNILLHFPYDEWLKLERF